MEFRFINNNTPLDRRSQRLVRNHAMKGKNLGRVIPARGHKRQQHEGGIDSDHLMTVQKCSTKGGKGARLLPKATRHGPDTALPPNPFSGAELAYFTSSVPLTPLVRYLFCEFHRDVSKELYPQIFCHQPKENETVWFKRVIEDPCVFHCAMAVTRAHISLPQGYDALESMWHFSRALHLLRRDLATNSKPQSSSLVAAISLAIYANLKGSTIEGRIHLEGLKRMVEVLPGGLMLLCSRSPEIGNKIRRADLELALLAGTPLLFSSQALPLPELPYVVPPDDKRPYVALPYPLGETNMVINFAMTDVLALCNYAGSSQLSAFQYQDIVLSILQRLIDFAPLCGARPSHQLDDVCQLGLLAFMSTVLNHTREKRFACSALLSNLLWTSLARFHDEMTHSQAYKYPSLHLWLMFIYTVSAPEYEQYCSSNSSVARCIQELATSLSLETWEDAAAHLIVFPWVAAFHDEASKKLWGVIRG